MTINSGFEDALAAAVPSTRLRAALSAGTHPDPRLAGALIARCAAEPDFFVRDMLTWALCRLPAEATVPALVRELGSATPQARSQSLHTLSKINDASAWPAVAALLHDADDEVARSAWRAAVALVPPGSEPALAAELATGLGRGDHDMWRSLSRALTELGESAHAALDGAESHPDPVVRAHAAATRRLCDDPDSGFAVESAKRAAALGPIGRQEAGC